MDRSTRHFDTIVIGAGVSGLACARRLFQHDRWRRAQGLCVLEARDRIGGRVEAVDVRGCRLDTGANWIHGVGTEERPNPLMSILPDKRVRKLSGSVVFRPANDPAARSDDDSDGWVHVSSPRPPATSPTMSTKDLVIPSKIAGNLTAAMWGTVGALHELAYETSADECKRKTVLEAISQTPAFKDAFNSLPPQYHSALRALPQFVENMEAAPLNTTSAEHEQDAPGMSLLEFKIDDFDGEQVFLQDGYAAVAQELGKDLVDAGLVRKGVEVESIEWNSDPIKVVTSEGTHTATDVVCTIPLGVLKERQQDLFQPPLPPEYSEAIENLGFGTLDKIFLVYPHAWWSEEPYKSIIQKGISRSPVTAEEANERNGAERASKDEPDFFIGFTNALAGIEIHGDGTVSNGARTLSLTNLHSLTGFPVISSFISCANAKHVEGLSDHEAGELIHSELTSWFGREPPRPDAVHVTRWATDRLSKGSYSHMIAGLSERKHREQFQQPLKNGYGWILSFAGEHTSSDHFATVHGALISGWDAADALIEDS